MSKEQTRKPTKAKPRKTDEEIKDEYFLKKISSAIKDDSSALIKACGNTADIALSGRMATSGLMSTIDGAMSIAHAITTHTVDSDIDWFTAVDDLQPLGSGHLDTQEFSAGVFYRYASLNLAQLQENLGGVDRSKALEVAAHLAHLLATETPNAKQRTFAAFNPADLVMVNFSDVPISLANAFEAPVRADKDGFLKTVN
ncbi:type I-E CRISPR-associated protein Cas7/Cse4/CasC [Shewanella hafniensis]|nr:type I-E CRISPR-associated protein Cas7/Cse4/CasC [Shewanella hafniensis]